jgi:PhnB protein
VKEENRETSPPTREFDEREEQSPMTRSAPEGWHTITPRIVVDDVEGLVAFVKKVFGATGDVSADAPAIVRIGDSLLMVSAPGVREPSAAFLYVYVDGVDDTYRRALDAGAVSLEAPQPMPYGDRRGMVRDSWGNTWQIASRPAQTATR